MFAPRSLAGQDYWQCRGLVTGTVRFGRQDFESTSTGTSGTRSPPTPEEHRSFAIPSAVTSSRAVESRCSFSPAGLAAPTWSSSRSERECKAFFAASGGISRPITFSSSRDAERCSFRFAKDATRADSWSSGLSERACDSLKASSTRHRRIAHTSSRQSERCSFMSVGALPPSVWSSSRSERACGIYLEEADRLSSFSCLLSIETDVPETSILSGDFETPLHGFMSDDSKLFMMEEGKLEDEGFGANEKTPLVGVTQPGFTLRTKSEEIDENCKTPQTNGLVWPVGMSKVQPLAPLDLGPGWYQLDNLIGSESKVGPAVDAEHVGEGEMTKQKRD